MHNGPPQEIRGFPNEVLKMHEDHNHEQREEEHHHAPHSVGHNTAHRPTQWQIPHEHHRPHEKPDRPEPDFDLVEDAFLAGFTTAPDPVSFLRLARVPLEGETRNGDMLKLLRVETDEAVDVALLTPHLGVASMRYDPLPAKLVSRRRRLHFVYFDGQNVRRLSFSEALALRK